MPRVKVVEKKIRDVEGFDVHIMRAGKNTRSDANLPKQYEAQRMTINRMSVSGFKRKLNRQYPGYDFKVLKKNGEIATGQTKLSTVRDTYLSDDE